LIIVARIVDVSLGTLRTAFIVQGRRSIAFLIGFVEVLIWITIVSKVITNLHQPVYAVSYAFGFGLGTFVGISVEAWMAKGQQVIRIFTRRGAVIAECLRSHGFVVTQFEGVGKEGPITMLFLETMRKQVPQIISFITKEDPDVFYIVDTVRHSSGRRRRYRNHTVK
ncbi:MAG TPA: DUF5698 domain-containing protein, partial [Thermodesulfobacteriota bacterium]|nr:DUF5698 domain-containing protein [Thermodesulfobacteriota bacterium]